MTATPIADQIAEEHRLLVELGFSPAQAKTIIVARTMESANVSTQIVPGPPAKSVVGLLDCDDDKWVRQEPGADQWVCPDAGLSVPHSREYLERHYGPLAEVFE